MKCVYYQLEQHWLLRIYGLNILDLKMVYVVN